MKYDLTSLGDLALNMGFDLRASAITLDEKRGYRGRTHEMRFNDTQEFQEQHEASEYADQTDSILELALCSNHVHRFAILVFPFFSWRCCCRTFYRKLSLHSNAYRLARVSLHYDASHSEGTV